MTRAERFQQDTKLLIENNQAIYAQAIKSMQDFTEAIRNLPDPPWNTVRRMVKGSVQK